jgi:hypothetical protein
MKTAFYAAEPGTGVRVHQDRSKASTAGNE